MSTLDRLYTHAKQQLPGALEDALKYAMYVVLDEFLEGSNIWKEVIEFETEVGKTEYDVVASQGVITRLITLVNEDEMPVSATMALPGLLVLETEPDTEFALTATVGLSVVDPVTSGGNPQVPDWVIVKYMNGILDGLLGHMMSQPAKPYTSERYAIYHMRRFRQVIAKAKVEAAHKNLHSAQAWQFPKNFA